MVAITLVMVKAAGVVDVIGVATAAAPTAAGRGGVRSAFTPMACTILQARSYFINKYNRSAYLATIASSCNMFIYFIYN